jgi:hypothetical protein
MREWSVRYRSEEICGSPATIWGQAAKTTRQLVLIDVENLSGQPCPTRLDVAAVESIVRDLIPDLNQAQCVVACSHRAARTVAFAFPGALRRWRSGPDGADLALIEEMSDLRVMRRFDQVTLVSGDGIFAEPMAALAAAGIETTVVSWESQLSARLKLAAQHVATLVDPQTTFGEAS